MTADDEPNSQKERNMNKPAIIAAIAAPLAAIAGTLEVPSVKFADGIAMPRFGIGTYAQGSNEICSNSVSAPPREIK